MHQTETNYLTLTLLAKAGKISVHHSYEIVAGHQGQELEKFNDPTEKWLANFKT